MFKHAMHPTPRLAHVNPTHYSNCQVVGPWVDNTWEFDQQQAVAQCCQEYYALIMRETESNRAKQKQIMACLDEVKAGSED